MRNQITTLLAVAAIVPILSTTAVYADLINELFKLLPDDGAPSDIFGNSIAIDGTTSIVGARGTDNKDLGSGSAYLFDINTGQQLLKLLPDEVADYEMFGRSVAISGTTAIVGSLNAGGNSAYLFNTRNGQQMAKLQANDDDGIAFGFAVAISDTIAMVGDPGHINNDQPSGAVYFFDIVTGQQIAWFMPKDVMMNDAFGISVAIGGVKGQAIAIAGAPHDDDNGNISGSAYLLNANTGHLITKLLPNDGSPGQEFGISVAISGTTAIIGARGDDENGIRSGSAYLFNTTTGQQIGKLLPNDGVENDFFGQSVAICETIAIIGALTICCGEIGAGSAYLFDLSTHKQITKLLSSDYVADDSFGSTVGITGSSGNEVAIVGARHNDDNGDNSGSAYLFDASATKPCPWDLDGSGSVGTGDLLALFAQWGTDGSADFDNSGTVNTVDLLILFANWGPCP